MADYGEATCVCGVKFTKKSHNQKYHNGDCKRNQENKYYRRDEPSLPKNFQEPAWPVIKPGPPVKIQNPKARSKKKDTAWKQAVILPDMQVGFFRDKAGNVYPTHDEDAISVARQIIRDVNPDQVILIGDTLDFPELSTKYRLSPQFVQTTQASIDRVTNLLGELKSDTAGASLVYISGNHEARAPNLLLDNAKAAFGLKRGCEPESWPVLSVPYLCRLDDFGVKYVGAYPAGVYWINDRLRVIHGDRVSSAGSTAHRYLNNERVSTIYGHIHRREWAERTRPNRNGPHTVLAASPGCLCRVDGVVPSTKGGIDEDGVPTLSIHDWQQGIALVTYKDGDSPFVYDQIAIWDGWAMWRDKEYTSTYFE